VPFDDDAADDVTGFRPPPHPDDRLWRHPSEVYATEPVTPSRTHGRLWPWGVAAVGTAGVMLAGAGTLLLGVQERVTAGDQQQRAAVTPLGSLPLPHLDGRPLSGRSSEGITELTDIARLADQLAPSLVHIDLGDEVAGGSGVVLSADGLTLTSAALVAGLDQVDVLLDDGRPVTGEVVGTDPLTDIAVIDLPGQHSAATMAPPTDVVGGEGILAMGATGSGRPATTVGPLSDRYRRLERSGSPTLEGLLHVDVPAQAVARGGPLVDQNGGVIGITVWTDDTGTYATPIDVAAKVANDVVDVGRARHGWLGIEGTDVGDAPTLTAGDTGGTDSTGGTDATDAPGGAAGMSGDGAGAGAAVSGDDDGGGGDDDGDDTARGVVVVTVDPAGPATDELHSGDVITRIDDHPVDDMGELTDAIRLRSPGDPVDVTVERDGGRTVEITLEPRPPNP
jgi:S1-C subfamily serine protease